MVRSPSHIYHNICSIFGGERVPLESPCWWYMDINTVSIDLPYWVIWLDKGVVACRVLVIMMTPWSPAQQRSCKQKKALLLSSLTPALSQTCCSLMSWKACRLSLICRSDNTAFLLAPWAYSCIVMQKMLAVYGCINSVGTSLPICVLCFAWPATTQIHFLLAYVQSAFEHWPVHPLLCDAACGA